MLTKLVLGHVRKNDPKHVFGQLLWHMPKYVPDKHVLEYVLGCTAARSSEQRASIASLLRLGHRDCVQTPRECFQSFLITKEIWLGSVVDRRPNVLEKHVSIGSALELDPRNNICSLVVRCC